MRKDSRPSTTSLLRTYFGGPKLTHARMTSIVAFSFGSGPESLIFVLIQANVGLDNTATGGGARMTPVTINPLANVSAHVFILSPVDLGNSMTSAGSGFSSVTVASRSIAKRLSGKAHFRCGC